MRPECQRCTSTGRTSDGYPAAGVPSQHSTRRALATAVRQLQVVGPASRVLGKPLPVDDVACFDFFRVCTASMTGSVFPGEKSWSMQMLQAAYAEPAVWKAAVALGALHRRWEFSNYCLNPNVTRQPGPQRDNTDVLQFTHQALKHYAVSLSLAILSVALGAGAHLAGRWADSQVHIRSGLRILREMKTQLRQLDFEGAGQALERLDAQAMTLSDATSPYEYTKSALEESRKLHLNTSYHQEPGMDLNPSVLLGSMNDLGQTALAIFRLMRQFFIIADAATTGGMSPREFEQARLQMVKATSRWEKQMTMLVDVHESKFKFANDREFSKRDQKVFILSLRLYQTTVEVLLFAHGTPPEPLADMSSHVAQQESDSPAMMSLDPRPKDHLPASTGEANIKGKWPSGVGHGFPHESLVIQTKGPGVGRTDSANSTTHVVLNSHLEVPFTPATSATGGFPLPAWAAIEPGIISDVSSAGMGNSNESANHLGGGRWCGSGSRPGTNVGPPGWCANPGYFSSGSSSSSSRPQLSSNTTTINLVYVSERPPQIQPKAPVAPSSPSSPSPILVPSRSPSPHPNPFPTPQPEIGEEEATSIQA